MTEEPLADHYLDEALDDLEPEEPAPVVYSAYDEEPDQVSRCRR